MRDIVPPAGVELLVDADRTVCSVMPPIVGEAEEEVVAEAVVAEPEVIGKGKVEGESEEE